jgi:hypothetical protein
MRARLRIVEPDCNRWQAVVKDGEEEADDHAGHDHD